MKSSKTFALCTIATCCMLTVQGQGILKKIKNAANNAANTVINAQENNNQQAPQGNNDVNPGQNNTGGKNNPSNRGGQGLVTTPPNVNENLSSAET
jgi:hypothetical protein